MNTYFMPALIFAILLLCTKCKNSDLDSSKVMDSQPIADKIKKNASKESTIDYTKLGIDKSSVANLKPLDVGSVAPEFISTDQNGRTFELKQELKKGDVVLIFYRGYWCPLCSRHLKTFADKLGDIKDKGAQVVVVSPETSQYIDSTVMNTKLDIPYLSDSENAIMKQYGVAFNASSTYLKKYKGWVGKELADVNNQENPTLPVPATYIISKDGKIKWVQYDPNYKNRATVDEILKAL